MHSRYVLVLYSVFTMFVFVSLTEYCRYDEEEENRYAYCGEDQVNHTFDFIPIISHFIIYINLSGQPLKELPYNAFQNLSSQRDVMTIDLIKCQIQQMDVDAFLNLDNLMFLDLSSNDITYIETGTFQHTVSLFDLSVHGNQIENLQTGLIRNLEKLKYVFFDSNRIEHVDRNVFTNTPSLAVISLGSNNLTYLDPLFKDNFENVTLLDINDNPWNCDCNLKELYDIYTVRQPKHLVLQAICENPLELHGKGWTNITSDKFICDPRIIMPANDTRLVAVNSTITLPCIVETYSIPDIKWYKDSEIITSESLSISSHKSTYYLNYTFTVRENNTGVYICIVHNLGLKLESNISLTVHRIVEQSTISNDVFVPDSKLNAWLMFFICLFVGAVLTTGFLFTRKVLQKLRLRHVQSNTYIAPMLTVFKHQEEDDYK